MLDEDNMYEMKRLPNVVEVQQSVQIEVNICLLFHFKIKVLKINRQMTSERLWWGWVSYKKDKLRLCCRRALSTPCWFACPFSDVVVHLVN